MKMVPDEMELTLEGQSGRSETLRMYARDVTLTPLDRHPGRLSVHVRATITRRTRIRWVGQMLRLQAREAGVFSALRIVPLMLLWALRPWAPEAAA